MIYVFPFFRKDNLYDIIKNEVKYMSFSLKTLASGQDFIANGGWSIFVVLGILIILVILFLFCWRKKRYSRQIKELRKKYDANHNVLTVDCLNMITRIEYIASNNPRYESILNQFKIAYNNNLTSIDAPCEQAIGSLEALDKEKQYRGIKDIIESTRTNINDFAKSVNKLNTDLSEILKDDDNCRGYAVVTKEKFRMVKEKLSSHATELIGLEEPFQLVFSEISEQLAEFEKSADGADYESANKIIKGIDQIITALDETLQDLPIDNTLLRVVLPRRIEEVTNIYTQMSNDHYPLHHLHFNAKIEKINENIETLKTKLSTLNINGVKDEIDSMLDVLDSFLSAFETEKEAKIQFEKEQANTSDNTYELEKDFAKLNRSLPEYKEIYIIDDSYLEQIYLIQEDIQRMSAIKRDLDSFIHSSTKQPYSLLLKKMSDLQSEMTKITNTLNDFKQYLYSLKQDAEKIYKSIRDNYAKLKEAEYSLRELNVEALQDQVHLSFVHAYTYLENENELLSKTPLDINALNSIYNEAQPRIESLLENISSEIELSQRAENAIVYGNLLRTSYSAVNNSLLVAEKAFFEADFTRASEESLNAIKTTRPDLIK